MTTDRPDVGCIPCMGQARQMSPRPSRLTVGSTSHGHGDVPLAPSTIGTRAASTEPPTAVSPVGTPSANGETPRSPLAARGVTPRSLAAYAQLVRLPARRRTGLLGRVSAVSQVVKRRLYRRH